MKKNKLGLIAAFATDTFFDEKGNLLRKENGGPAYFISNVFNRNKFPFSIVASSQMTVDIILTDEGEFGKVNPIPTILIDFSKIKMPNVLVSPILDEFTLEKSEKYDGKLFLDIQGFIRNAGSMEKKTWNPSKELGNSIFCLKVADYELPFINSDFINKQKQKILLETAGAKGATIYAFGKKHFTEAKKMNGLKDTIGAGDTFLASFVVKFIETENPEKSAEFASEKTAEFLSQKSDL